MESKKLVLVCKIFLLLVIISTVASDRLDPMTDEDLFEGDITGVSTYTTVPLKAQLWPKGMIYYDLTSDIMSDAKFLQNINGAMAEIEENSCLRFIRRTAATDYILIHRGGGCYSHVGRIGGMQELSLGKRCDNHGIILHQLLHAIGFFHEHRRSDRDDYLNIFWDNIAKHNHKHFRRMDPRENVLLTSFDYESIMLLGSTSFSISGNQVTMKRIDGQLLPHVYEKKGLSKFDITRLKIMYPC